MLRTFFLTLNLVITCLQMIGHHQSSSDKCNVSNPTYVYIIIINKKDAPIQEVLQQCLATQPIPLEYFIQGTTITIVKKEQLKEKGELTDRLQYKGTVLGQNGSPLVGAAVLVKELNRFSVTNGVNYLDEKVAKGYYNTTKRLNTGDLTIVRSEDIQKQPVSDPIMALEGRVPGLYINLADIGSIEISKDADATAIYGSRGANGIILITTQKGKVGRTQVDVNVYIGEGRIVRKLKLLNTQQYLAMRHEAFGNDNKNPGPIDYDVNGAWDTPRYTNWQKLLIGNPAHYVHKKRRKAHIHFFKDNSLYIRTT